MRSAKTPSCVGIIIDGNRRWARQHGVPIFEGHRRGYQKIKEFLRWARQAGIHYIIVYVFSSENWNRSPEEVSYLMKLLKKACTKEIKYFKKENARIRIIGDRMRLDSDVREAVEYAEQETAANTGETLVLAISYGGRDEIVEAAKRMCKEHTGETITQETFASYLWTSDIPDPDIIIRTSGEKRLSNFLPWQSIYSELFFPEMFWPDFTKEDFHKILMEFGERQRRFGT